jgi:hypothetical protein
MIELFGTDECIPTLLVDISEDWKTNYKIVQTFISNNNNSIDGYVKSLYGFDNQLSSFHFTKWEKYTEIIPTYIELYKQQHQTNLLPLYRVYIPVQQYPFIYKPSYIVQKCFNLVTYPHWRLVIASACIFDKEILMWPLVDGYSGWYV